MTSQERKQYTEDILKKLNVEINPSLPCIEDETEAKIRSGRDVAKRILVLVYLNILEDGANSKIIQFLKYEQLWDAVSDGERTLFNKDILTEQERIKISWRSEAIWLLLWAIYKVELLDLPINECDVSCILERVPKCFRPVDKFVSKSYTRSTTEILNMSDLIYRLHWASRNAEVQNQSNSTTLNSDVLEEWHYAINWLTFHADDWDDITTDT